jgi:hypothetical protein
VAEGRQIKASRVTVFIVNCFETGFPRDFRLDCSPDQSGNRTAAERAVVISEYPINDAITELIHSLPTLAKERLNGLWQDNFGKVPGKVRRELMLPVLAFRIQEKAYGGLSPETKKRLRQVMESLEPKRRSHQEARNRFMPGTRLVREWKGRTHEVTLTEEGYDYRGKKYKSLSPIACEITGTHWSGPAFFGTRKKEVSK